MIPYLLIIKNFMTPQFFSFQDNYDTQYIWDPPSEENDSPLDEEFSLQDTLL